MGLKEDLETDVKDFFRKQWTESETEHLPEPEDIQLGNDAKKLKRATVLYADLAGSTTMVNSQLWYQSAEVYKAYLHCAAKIIRDCSGEITAYDGDRIMAVFIEGAQSTNAVKCGLKINWIVKNVVNPAFKAQYPDNSFTVRQVVGIDTSGLRIARVGVRGDNDLVWVGRAANYAAKLTELSADYPTWITGSVYDAMLDPVKSSNGKSMWEERTWTNMNNMRIFRSHWSWSVD
jgi:class 3 adenylate cyclase